MLISYDMIEWCDRHGLAIELSLAELKIKLVDAESESDVSESSIAGAHLTHMFALDRCVAAAIKDAARVLYIDEYPIMATLH